MPTDDTMPERDAVSEAALARFLVFHHRVTEPLLQRRGSVPELLADAERLLVEEADPDNRLSMFGDVASVLHCVGEEDLSWEWCQRGASEARDDPVALNRLATWYFYNPLREPTADDLALALEYNAAAVDKARKAHAWCRLILHDRCRIATAAGRFDIVAEAMREILDVWPNPDELDIPMFEWDWLARVPEGAIDEALRADYQSVVSRVLENRRRREEEERAAAGKPAPAVQPAGVVMMFEAFAEDAEGNVAPFRLVIRLPLYDPNRGYFCSVECPYLREKPFLIFGVDEDQACELAAGFVPRLLEGRVRLIDDEGNEVTIPEVDFCPKFVPDD